MRTNFRFSSRINFWFVGIIWTAGVVVGIAYGSLGISHQYTVVSYSVGQSFIGYLLAIMLPLILTVFFCRLRIHCALFCLLFFRALVYGVSLFCVSTTYGDMRGYISIFLIPNFSAVLMIWYCLCNFSSKHLPNARFSYVLIFPTLFCCLFDLIFYYL